MGMSLTTPDPARPALHTDAQDDLSARVAAFREQYVDKLAAPNGWWAIASLDWLEPGENLLGSSPDARLPLPAGAPERAALLSLEGEQVTVTPLAGGLVLDGAELTEPRATNGVASLEVPAGDATLAVKLLKRGDLFGVRVYDPRLAAGRDRETSVAWYEPNPEWVVDAEFLPPLPGETIPIVNALGQVTDAEVAGRAAFERDGQRYTLVATPAGVPGRLFFNFRDLTNVRETYGGGRFLNVDGPVNGRIRLDFNLCHHPPCAHTPYATCPVPPEENRLPFEVRAGERYADGAYAPH
mgnify:CR=1 FL=1|jgi:uncharacterized protein (DUF1684 family)